MRRGRIRRRYKKLGTKRARVNDHCRVRCLQRLGYIPDLDELVKLIQEHRLTLFDKQSNRVTRWKWTDPVHGVQCILPYDKMRKQIITVLFEDIRILNNTETDDGTEDKLCTSTCSDIETEEGDRETSTREQG